MLPSLVQVLYSVSKYANVTVEKRRIKKNWPWGNLSPAANWPRIGQNRTSILSNPRVFVWVNVKIRRGFDKAFHELDNADAAGKRFHHGH